MQTETDPADTFGTRLAAVRKKAGLTQEQLGIGMGPDGRDLGKGAVSCWEQDVSQPNASQLRLLCERLNLASDYLLFGERRKSDRKAA